MSLRNPFEVLPLWVAGTAGRIRVRFNVRKNRFIPPASTNNSLSAKSSKTVLLSVLRLSYLCLDRRALNCDRGFSPECVYIHFNPFKPSGPFCLNRLNPSDSNRRCVGLLFLLLQCFIEIPVFNANGIESDQSPDQPNYVPSLFKMI